MCKYVCTL
jgi:hypothetical protein